MKDWQAIACMLCGAASLLAAPALAQTGTSRSEAAEVEFVPLKPGQFLWFERPAAIGGATSSISIIVSISSQVMYVYRGETLIAVSTVSTGKRGKATPVGEFTILEKREFHRSNLYSNAPMPWMQRLTWDGIALHGGHLPGYPASHGCIRMPAAFARRLFDLTRTGATVSIVGDAVPRRLMRQPAVPMLVADPRGFTDERWNVVTASAERAEPAVR
ncbi:MAG: L,D-transpeptidase family protein [Sphingomonas sp.]